MTWVVAGGGLVVLVFLHELGHFSVALAVGMRPRSFYIGFPPALAKVKRNGIEYGIGMIPLGGLVRIPGMHRPAAHDVQVFMEPAIGEQGSLAPAALTVRRALAAGDYAAARAAYPELEEDVSRATLSPRARRSANRALREVEEGTAPDAYWRAATWKRVAVIAAGPLANVLVAFLILFVMFASSGAPTNRGTATVAQVIANTPAAQAGLLAGDRVVAVDGKPARTYASIRRLITSSDGAPITVTVIRNGQRITLGPEAAERENGRWVWGFASAAQLARVPVGKAATKAGTELGQVVTETGSAIGSLFHSRSRAHLTSVIGIEKAGAAALKEGATYYLELLALVSMALALMNLLPLLPLDGGHILFSLIEAVRHRALAREVYERVSVVGFALILLVFTIAVSNDFSGATPH
jgi:regulator of sigma E protease